MTLKTHAHALPRSAHDIFEHHKINVHKALIKWHDAPSAALSSSHTHFDADFVVHICIYFIETPARARARVQRAGVSY